MSPLPPGFAETAPGPLLAGAVAGIERAECNGYELEELLRARRKLIAFLEAECLADVAALAHTPPDGPDSPALRSAHLQPHTAAVLEPLLGWTAYHADWYLALALAMAGLPRTRQALLAGELEPAASSPTTLTIPTHGSASASPIL